MILGGPDCVITIRTRYLGSAVWTFDPYSLRSGIGVVLAPVENVVSIKHMKLHTLGIWTQVIFGRIFRCASHFMSHFLILKKNNAKLFSKPVTIIFFFWFGSSSVSWWLQIFRFSSCSTPWGSGEQRRWTGRSIIYSSSSKQAMYNFHRAQNVNDASCRHARWDSVREGKTEGGGRLAEWHFDEKRSCNIIYLVILWQNCIFCVLLQRLLSL